MNRIDDSGSVVLGTGDSIVSQVTDMGAALGHGFRGTQSGHKVDGSRTPPTAPTCAAPSFIGRTRIWTGTVTVAADSMESPNSHGYEADFSVGGLSGAMFMLGANNYTIDRLSVGAPGTTHAGQLSFGLSMSDLTATEVATLKVHICDDGFDFSSATHDASGHTYTWPSASLDWSSVTTRTVYLSVPDNAAPEFTEGAPATREIQETLGSATTATPADIGAAVAATDTGDTLTYTLEGTDASSFDIVSASGQLRTKAGVAYDYETKDEYSVTVKVSDGTAEVTIAVTIDVSNEDEAGTVTFSSDPPRAGTALVASLTDLDGTVSNVTWQWSSAATAGGTFTDIASATSASYTPAAGDVGNFLKATASYEDPQGSGKAADAVSASATQAALNAAPEFTEGAAATREIQETLGSDTTATPADIGAAVAATDTDTGDTLTYTLEGTDASSFDIVSASGQLRTKAGEAYDHEANPSYSVTVKVSDGTASDTIVVTISVTNVDEAGAVTLTNDNPPRVGTALVASVTDPDGHAQQRDLAVVLRRHRRWNFLQHHRRHVGLLHAGDGGRGQLPEGDGELHRPAGFGQDGRGCQRQRHRGCDGAQRRPGVHRERPRHPHDSGDPRVVGQRHRGGHRRRVRGDRHRHRRHADLHPRGRGRELVRHRIGHRPASRPSPTRSTTTRRIRATR